MTSGSVSPQVPQWRSAICHEKHAQIPPRCTIPRPHSSPVVGQIVGQRRRAQSGYFIFYDLQHGRWLTHGIYGESATFHLSTFSWPLVFLCAWIRHLSLCHGKTSSWIPLPPLTST